MSWPINEFDECWKEVENKFGGKINARSVRSLVRSGRKELLASVDRLYAELIDERVRWMNLELSHDCFGRGWNGEGYFYEQDDSCQVK